MFNQNLLLAGIFCIHAKVILENTFGLLKILNKAKGFNLALLKSSTYQNYYYGKVSETLLESGGRAQKLTGKKSLFRNINVC